MIILITASLSSNTHDKASWCEDWTFEETASMSCITSIFLWDLWCLWTSLSSCTDRSETRETVTRTETIRPHSSRASNPSNPSPVSKEIFSDSVELWETAVCFLHIQLIGTNVWLPKMHNVPPEVDFESLRSTAKSESWNSPSLHYLAVLPTWQYCLYSHVWWKMKSIDSNVCHKPWSILWWIVRAYLLTIEYQVFQFVPNKHFRTIWEQICDISPKDFISYSLKWWSSMHGVDTL